MDATPSPGAHMWLCGLTTTPWANLTMGSLPLPKNLALLAGLTIVLCGFLKQMIQRATTSLFLAIIAVGLVQTTQATTISISTAQSGGNRKVNSTTPAIWNFTISEAGAAAGLSVVSGNFLMRRDNGVTDPVVFSFYRGFSYNATGGTELLGSFTNTTVASGGAGYSPALFTITPTANLTQGAYSFTLTSNAVSNSSYNLKGQASDPPELLDATTGTLVSTTYFANAGANPTPYPSPTPGPTPVPEPRQVLAALLTAAGIGICLVLNHRRNRIEVLRRFTPAS